MISRIKRLYRSRRRNKRPSLSFFVRFFRRAYSFFFHKRFLLKKKNLRKLCLLLSRYKSLRNLSQYNRDRGFRLINLLTIRNLKEIKKFKRLFRFKGKGFSRRRRFFLRRYWEFTNRKYRRYRKYRRRTRFNNRRTSFPPIKDAKLLCDYVVYYLNMRVRLYRIFSNSRFWQRIEYRLTNTLKHKRYIDNDFVYKKYPLSGIRILCSGSFKKGGRKRRNYYHLWIRNQRLTRKMPLQTIEMDIDYFYSNTNVITGTVGVKVWLCFSTISYRYKMVDNFYYV